MCPKLKDTNMFCHDYHLFEMWAGSDYGNLSMIDCSDQHMDSWHMVA